MTILEERRPAPVARIPERYDTSGWRSEPPPRHRSRRLRLQAQKLWTEGRVVCAAVFALYLTIGMLLDFRYLVYPADAVSRMANGFYVLYSRHPHLAAIGFVWNPLTSILDMGPLLFKDLWPALASHDVAGSLVSACCMTGAVHQLRSALRESGLRRAPRWVLSGLFALNPMILYYAGNGMSEALYLFTALAVCRYLRRWYLADDVRSLVYAASFLGLCYLAREEAVAISAASVALVLWRSFTRAKGDRRPRIFAALTDGTIFALPVATAFVGWALASFIITGQPFQQFTSQYGNSTELAVYGSLYGSSPGHEITRIVHEATDLTYLAPLLPLILLIAIVGARRSKDWQILVPLAVLGGGLGFTLLGYLDNQIFPWLRFYILAIPLEVLAVGAIMSVWSPSSTARGTHSRAAPHPPAATKPKRGFATLDIVALGGVVAALVLIGPSLLTAGLGMFNPKVGIEESYQLGFLIHEKGTETAAQRAAVVPMLGYIEQLNLPDGSVVTDEDLEGCATTMIVRSSNPKVFVIPNDVDFKQILADPLTFHARYILAPKPVSYDVKIELSETYPTLYRNGAGFAKLVKSFPPTALCPPYRLYKVFGHPQDVAG